jgi:hypothetical protein
MLGTSGANDGLEMLSGSSSGPPLLEALPAKNRPALRWLEGNGGLLATGRTVSPSFHSGARPGGHRSQGGVFFRFADFTAFGLVPELLVVKEELFSGCEDEVSAAVNTLQNFVLEFHGKVLPSVRDPKPWRGLKMQLPPGPD